MMNLPFSIYPAAFRRFLFRQLAIFPFLAYDKYRFYNFFALNNQQKVFRRNNSRGDPASHRYFLIEQTKNRRMILYESNDKRQYRAGYY